MLIICLECLPYQEEKEILIIAIKNIFGPELAYRLRVAQPTLMTSLDIFDILLY